MRYKVDLQKDKMTERQVRDSIEKASQTARNIAQQRGEGDRSHDSFRRDMVKNAERDRKDGKI
ncbi:hypothetical protein EBZ39_07975 [bacterium]|nr:hypothetical protein [bacterium]